jgi:hypothetical protein
MKVFTVKKKNIGAHPDGLSDKPIKNCQIVHYVVLHKQIIGSSIRPIRIVYGVVRVLDASCSNSRRRRRRRR